MWRSGLLDVVIALQEVDTQCLCKRERNINNLATIAIKPKQEC